MVHGEQGFADAEYRNEDTDVYCRFDYDPGRFRREETESIEDLPDEPDPCPMLPVAFDLNYYRPHPFGVEAEMQVKAFVAAFDLRVVRPPNLWHGRR